MSKYDKAGLAMIPSGYKDSKVYSLIPNSSVGDFDFTRASTATRVNKDGLIDTVASGVPRLEYPIINGVVGDTPSLLLEPSRTNLLTYSSGFTTDWNNTNITINSNSIISPDGTQNATKFIPDTTSGQHFLDRNGVTVNSNASASIFAKKGEYKRFSIRSYFTGANAIFDVNIGFVISASSVTAEIKDYGNGWFRCSLNETLNVNYGYGIFVMEDDSNNPLDNYAGNNIDGMYFYGAQLEESSYPTSYIPTSGTTVTRAEETCIDSGSTSEINSQEGVLFCEIASNSETADTRQVISLGDGSTGNNRVSIEYNSGTTNEIKLQLRTATLQASLPHTVDSTKTFHKVVGRYKLNDVQLWIDGFRVGRDQTSDVSAVDTLQVLSFRIPATSYFFGRCKQLISFKEYLTDSEIEDLTSWDSFNEMATAQEYIIK